MKRREVPVSGTRVAVWDVGEGTPLLALHGVPLGHKSVQGSIEGVMTERSGWRRIYIDMPGFGETPSGDVLPSADSLLEVVLEVVEVVAEGEALAVFGQSYGGYLGLGLAEILQDQLAGLCLVVPAVEPDFGSRALPEPLKLVSDDEGMSLLPKEFLDEARGLVVRESRQLAMGLLDWLGPSEPDFVTALQGEPYSFARFELPTGLRVPTLLVSGRQDAVVGYEQATALVSGFERATVAVVDGAGHVLELERPHLVNALLSEWLDRVEEFLDSRGP